MKNYNDEKLPSEHEIEIMNLEYARNNPLKNSNSLLNQTIIKTMPLQDENNQLSKNIKNNDNF